MSYMTVNGRSIEGGGPVIGPGKRSSMGDTTAGTVLGKVFDIITSRPGALLISGTLVYLLVKSPAARKELWGTAKERAGAARKRLSASMAK